jgi:hypothetical protein
MGKSVDSLGRYCAHELQHGAIKVNAKIAGKLFQKAMDGDTAALIFWTKTRMGWKETDRHEHEHRRTYDLDNVPDADLTRLESIFESARSAGGDQDGTGEEASGSVH